MLLIELCTLTFPESKNNSPTLYEILFDEVFLGGLKLRCSSNRAYRLPASCLLSISYGTRIEEAKKEQRTYTRTRPGADYASVASFQSNPPPHNYRVNYEGASSHRHLGHHDYDMPDYHYSRARPNHGNKEPRSRNEDSRSPKGVRSKEKTEGGRGKAEGSRRKSEGGNKLKAEGGERDTKKTILKRGSSLQTSSVEKAIETSHDYKPPGSTGDDFSAAMNALSRLNISPYDESLPPKSTNQRADDGWELSPSATGMFDAQEERAVLSAPKPMKPAESKDHSTNLKNILGIGSSELSLSVSPPTRDMPEAIHKLMGPPVGSQPRGPLLPGPPFSHHPQPHGRGKTCRHKNTRNGG